MIRDEMLADRKNSRIILRFVQELYEQRNNFMVLPNVFLEFFCTGAQPLSYRKQETFYFKFIYFVLLKYIKGNAQNIQDCSF